MAITIFDKDISNLTDVELTKRLKAQSSKANSRLYNLEKTGLSRSSEAYGIVERKNWDRLKYAYKTDYQGRARFRTDTRNRDRKDLVLELQEVERFLSYQTSTTSGIKKARYNQYEGYLNFWREQLKDPSYNISFEDYSEYWKDRKMASLKNVLGSGEQASIFSLASEKGFSSDELHEILKDEGLIEQSDDIEPKSVQEVKAYIETKAYIKNHKDENEENIYKEFLSKQEEKDAFEWESSENNPW